MNRIAAVKDTAPYQEPKNTAPLPPPLLSSRRRGWDDLAVELHHFRNVDVVVSVSEHIVGVHLSGAVNLLQSRGGHAQVKCVRPGDITITPAGDPKRFQHSGDNIVLLLKLAPAFVRSVAGDEYAQDPARFEIRENFGTSDPFLFALGKRILAALEYEGVPGRMRIESLKGQLATHLLRHYCAVQAVIRKTMPRLSPRNLHRALDYIDSHLREDISLAQVAAALGISPYHFAHAFKQTTGLPPHRFLVERRIERAKALLLETDLPITEIAHCIGCASHSHFSVLFRRATGQTPHDFRS